jgi:2-hydroxychromene-2-carboxylate isomerase
VDAAFYFDLSSPFAYFAAERILQVVPGPVEWQPVLARELPAAESFEAYRCEAEEQIFRAELERRAQELHLQPLRWPAPFPFDSGLAMRAATYAKSIGRVVPFAQAAFRQAFAGGHDLERADFVLIAAAACEMHPQAVLRGAELRTVRELLAHTTAEAARAGVGDVPAVRIGERVLSGERALEEAAGLLDVAGSAHAAAGSAPVAGSALAAAGSAPVAGSALAAAGSASAARARNANSTGASDAAAAGVP